MAVAVADRYRGRGGSVADEAITVALEAAADHAAQQGQQRAYVYGYVHDKNLPSQRMCRRRGFTHDGAAPLANYQQWSVVVTLTPAYSAP
jgi:GNAT superfamily N-acetyltransferase